MTDETPTPTAYRIVSESGTHFATVDDRDEAFAAREYYADRYLCIVLLEPVYGPKPQRW